MILHFQFCFYIQIVSLYLTLAPKIITCVQQNMSLPTEGASQNGLCCMLRKFPISSNNCNFLFEDDMIAKSLVIWQNSHFQPECKRFNCIFETKKSQVCNFFRGNHIKTNKAKKSGEPL